MPLLGTIEVTIRTDSQRKLGAPLVHDGTPAPRAEGANPGSHIKPQDDGDAHNRREDDPPRSSTVTLWTASRTRWQDLAVWERILKCTVD